MKTLIRCPNPECRKGRNHEGVQCKTCRGYGTIYKVVKSKRRRKDEPSDK